MNSQQAREILLLYRPAVDLDAPEFAEAIALTKADPELNTWFQQHCAFQNAARAAFNHIPVPDGLKQQILSERRAHLTLSTRRKLLATASILVILTCIGVFTFQQFRPNPKPDNTFANFQASMRGYIYRYPHMDLLTNDLQAIRRNLAEHGQTNLKFTAALDKIGGTGCATLDWHDKPVAMICFNSGKNGKPNVPDVFLFIVDKTSIKDPPPGTPVISQTRKSLVSGSWTAGNKTYVLAVLGDEDFLRPYF